MVTNEEYKSAKRDIKKYVMLRLCKDRDLDDPNNLLDVCEINLQAFQTYFDVEFADKHVLGTDIKLVTHIYNYVSSLKSYFNRKIKGIEKSCPQEFKQGMLQIVREYWKAGRRDTIIDKLVLMRDKLEHEDIMSGLGISVYSYNKFRVKTITFYGQNINALLKESYSLLKEMNKEINNFIKTSLRTIKIAKALKIMNRFYREHYDKFFFTYFSKVPPFQSKRYRILTKVKDV